jgi:hypothetical protein
MKLLATVGVEYMHTHLNIDSVENKDWKMLLKWISLNNKREIE